uniref:Uncharacterized protein n=1 Tax=Tetradesmus obliquus TaxID=3088 RepID=A0A383VLW1_TETOB|eukprot:jgi/Sobl393_1/10078/SZX65396.1
MSPRMSPLSSAAPAPGQSKAAAGQSQSQSNNNVSLTGGVAPVPAPVPATAPAMPFAAAEEEFSDSTAQHNQQQQLACWYSIPSAPGQTQEAALLAAEPGSQFCARWQMRCTLPSTACSQSDVAARAWRWVYGSVDQPGCRAMMKTSGSAGSSSSSKGMRDAMCCSGSGCNKPDSRLDAATRIRRDAAAESAVGPAVQQPAILQPGTGPGAAMQQPVLIAAVGSAGRGPGSAWISRLSSSSSSKEGNVRGR